MTAQESYCPCDSFINKINECVYKNAFCNSCVRKYACRKNKNPYISDNRNKFVKYEMD